MMSSAFLRTGRLVVRSQYFAKVFLSNPVLYKNQKKLQHTYASRTKIASWIEVEQSEKLSKARTTEQLLACADELHLNGKQMVFIFDVLRQLTIDGQTKIEDFAEDSRFVNLCGMLQADYRAIDHSSLVCALRSVLQIGLSPEQMIVNTLENEVLWKARKMNLKSLISCLGFHRHYQDTELQKTVVNEVIQVLQKRWFEINSGFIVIRLFQHADLFSREFLEKVEDQAIDLMDKMTTEQMQKLLICLSQLNRRPTPLLRAISYHMNQRNDKLTAKQLVNMLFALNALCFPDSTLMQNISNNLITVVANIDKPQLMSTLLISLGQLCWRNESLLEACSDWIIKNINICRPQEIAAYILTLARVSYYPGDISTIFHSLSPFLTEKYFDVKKVWLDVVWSLAVLKQVTPDHLSSVLNPSFYGSLIDSNDKWSFGNKLKLLNLKSYAVIEHPLDPSLSGIRDLTLENVEVPRTESAKQLAKSVLYALCDMVPEGKFMVSDQNTHMGVSISAEFIVDKKGKPLPIEKHGVRSGLSNICKPLPPNIYRIALLVWDFKDFTLDSQVLTGVNVLAVQMIKKLGYTIVEVPYTEYSDKLTPVKKVQYLQLKISEAIQKSESNM